MERMMLEWEMLKQNEIDKQREHEQNILEVELEAKRKMAQTEKRNGSQTKNCRYRAQDESRNGTKTS